jgi:methylase of polypeptide subunit release factors
MNKWDRKAKNYNRYNEKEDSFEQRIFQTLEDIHVEFEDKTMLDIGAGTGVYTLHLAKKCLHVDAIDSSKKMLEFLKKDAKTLNLANISTYVTSWQNFDIKGKYDIALSTMSPAVRNESDIEKMNNSADLKIYLGWAGIRDTLIIDQLFLHHGEKYIAPNGAARVVDWLNKHKKFHELFPFEEEKIRVRTLEESIENSTWHLDVRGIKPDLNIIKKVLNKFVNSDGNIIEKSTNHMYLVIWE